MFRWILLYLQISFAIGGISTAWERFWDVSCEYSSPIAREKRSYLEEPNFEDPEELFKFLYPNANVKPEDFRNESQRSAYPPPSLSSWVSDLIEFWQNECYIRTEAAAEAEEGDEEEEYEDEEMEPDADTDSETSAAQMTLVGNGSFGNLSSLQLQEGKSVREGKSSRSRSGVYGTPNFGPLDTGNRRMVSSPSAANYGTNGIGFGSEDVNGQGTSTNRPRKKLRKRQRQSSSTSTTTTTTTTPATTTAQAATKADPEVFFSSYGGDIEYFFPLISFGIPFDGEITFLGFHGFKGLFPYR